MDASLSEREREAPMLLVVLEQSRVLSPWACTLATEQGTKSAEKELMSQQRMVKVSLQLGIRLRQGDISEDGTMEPGT